MLRIWGCESVVFQPSTAVPKSLLLPTFGGRKYHFSLLIVFASLLRYFLSPLIIYIRNFFLWLSYSFVYSPSSLFYFPLFPLSFSISLSHFTLPPPYLVPFSLCSLCLPTSAPGSCSYFRCFFLYLSLLFKFKSRDDFFVNCLRRRIIGREKGFLVGVICWIVE